MGGLALSVRKGHSVTIGDDIVVTCIDANRGVARLLFDAPRDVRIIRDDAKVRVPKPRPTEEGD
ncbi:carbon storage regulator [Porticoccus sp.]